MDNSSFIFAPDNENSVAVVHSAGYSDTDTPRHHPKNSGFLFEYILSGEECAESPESLVKAGIGSLVIVSSAEECVLYKTAGEVSALHFSVSGFVLDAVSEVLALPRIFCGEGAFLDRFLDAVKLYDGYVAGNPASCKAIIELAFSLLLSAAELNSAGSVKEKPTAEKIKEYLDLCICGDVDLDSVGDRFGITGMHVIRLFRTKYDETPMQYLKLTRLDKAASLLRKTDMTIKEISGMLRFSSTQHFTNLFHEKFGTSPGKYRENANRKRRPRKTEV